MIRKFLNEHETVASILTIVLAVAAINGWLTSDIRDDIKVAHSRIDSQNTRLDQLYSVMMDLIKEKR